MATTKQKPPRQIVISQLRTDRATVRAAVRQKGGCIVVDEQGKRLFTLCLPQGPIDAED